MKYDIEVVGERCRRKDEPRATGTSHGSPALGSPNQPPGTPEETLSCNGQTGQSRTLSCNGQTGQSRSSARKLRRSASVGSKVFVSCPSWRHTPFYGQETSAAGRGLGDYRDVVSRGEMGMKVRISYIDRQGRVSATPRSAKLDRSLSARMSDKEQRDGSDKQPSPDSDAHNDLSGWGSNVSITSLVDRLYRSDKRTLSARDKAFNAVLDKQYPSGLDYYGQPYSPSPNGVTTEEVGSNHPAMSSTSMPSVQRSPIQLTRCPSLNDGHSTSNGVINSGVHGLPVSNTTTNGGENHTRNLMTAYSTTVNHSMHHTSISNGCSPAVPRLTDSYGSHCTLRTNGGVNSSLGCSMTNGKGLHPYSEGFPPRPLTSSPGKHVHFSVQESVRDRLRSVNSHRRVLSASSRRWSRGPESVTGDRVRGRRKVSIQQAQEVVRDENGSPSVSKLFRKFRLVGFIAVTLIRLKAAIVVNSLDRTERSASEIQWRTLYGEQEAEKLAFNKSLFSRERISTKMPRWALRIFETSPEDRTEQDCRRLHALFRGMRSFDKFTEEIQLNLCRAFSYSCVGESRIVLRRGHVGHNFYFIYSGSVFVNVQDTDSDGIPFIKTEAILGRGDSFGELALLQDIRRTATVTVRETCELLVVDKDVFGKVCPKIFEKELMEKKNFISRLSLFSTKWWSVDSLNSLCMEAQIQEYKINKIVVENNTTEDWLYICMEGKCQVIRCLSEDKEEEEVHPTRGREPSVVLSEEIIELLSSASIAPQNDTEEEEQAENSKEKLLSSLGLEYVHTGKRRGAFIEEVEVEARKKALLASSGPMTLTSLMAQQQKDGKCGLVYINVGSLESEDVFDMCSLVKTPAQRSSSALLLVSSGARMLRMKKTVFHRLASIQAMEHTRTLVSKQPFPSEASIQESYKRKILWDAYKAKVVEDVFKSRDLHSAQTYRGRKKKGASDTDSLSLERSQTSSRLLTALNRSTVAEKKRRTARLSSVSDKAADEKTIVENGTGGPDEQQTAESNADAETEKLRTPIFPVVEVDTEVEPLTPKPESDTVPDLEVTSTYPQVPPHSSGSAPCAVIVRRKSSGGASGYRPFSSTDTTFVTRRRKSRDDVATHVTRFSFDTDLDLTEKS